MKNFPGALTAVVLLVLTSLSALAVTPITSIQAYYDVLSNTNGDFSSPGAGTGAFPTGTTYRSTFTAGAFDNLHIAAFDVGTNNYIFRQLAQRINLVRVDNPTITGAHHIIMYDQNAAISGTNITLRSEYEPMMENILLSDIINRGVDNIFCNTGNGDGNNNNIERIDYIFADGYPAFGNLTKRGFMLMDRGGNDACQIAAVLSLDTNGLPATFSKPVMLATSNWGPSGLTLDTVVYRGYGATRRPSADVGVQDLTGQYIEWVEFGIQTNTLVYGYSIVAADVPTNANWANPASFPLGTTEGSNSGGLDLMSGGALVLDEAQNAVLGNYVWNDVNQNGLQDPDERGVTNVLVQAYDSTGTNLAGQARSDDNGYYNIFALVPGTYLIKVNIPTNWVFTTQDVGPDDTIDSDVNINTGNSSFFYLSSGITNNNWDAGMYLPPTDLGVTKSVNNAAPRVGTSIVFTITLTNAGPYATDQVSVYDLIPAGLTYSGAGASIGSYDPTNGLWTVGTASNSARPTLVITALVDQASAGLTLTNTTYINYSERPDTNSANNTASVVVVVRSVDIGVGKSISTNLIGVTNFITYRVSVTNYGPDTALSVTLTDAIPAGLTFSNATASAGSYSTNTSLWSIGDMLSGATATLTITAKVSAASGGWTITNTARALTTGMGDTNAANDSASVLLYVVGADLGVIKSANNSAPYPGANVIYTITLTNNGPSDAKGVTLTELLTNGLTYVSYSATSGTYNNVSGIWTVGTVLANSAQSLFITATVATNTINSLITNKSTITSTDMADGNLLNNTGVAVIAVSSLRISKTSSGTGNVVPGSNLTYTIIITNAGSLVHTNVTVTDAIPTGTTYVANSIVVGPILTNNVLDQFSSTNYANNDGSMNWADSWSEINEVTSPTAGNIRIYTNVLRISGSPYGIQRPVDLNGTTNAQLSFTYRRNNLSASSDYVSINVSSDGGSTFSVAGRVAGPNNDSSFQSSNINISAYASTGTVIRFISSGLANSEFIHFDNVQVSWVPTTYSGPPPDVASNWTLQAGGYISITYTARVDNPLAVTQIVNTAYATSTSQILPISGAVTDNVAAADLTISKSVNTPVTTAGSNVAYTITVTNNGPSTAIGVIVTERLTNGLTYVSYGASSGAYTSATGIWTVGTITASASVKLTITAQVSSASQYLGATLTNISRITSANIADPITSNNEASATVTVTAADLAVNKSASNLTTIYGETVVFTMGVTNIGPSTATNITLVDILPAAMSYVSSSPSQGTYSPASGIWTVGTLSVGGYASMTVSATVTTTVVNVNFTNRISVSTSSQTDPVTGNNTSAVVLVMRSTDPVGIKKTSSAAGQAPPGSTNTYTITITNGTSFTHTGITVTDFTPTGMTFVASSTFLTYPQVIERFWLDTFASRLYANNYGNTNWLTNWTEQETTDPLTGRIRIAYDPYRGTTYSLQYMGSNNVNHFIRRSADLGGFSNATLSFDYRRESMEVGDNVSFQINSNGYAGTWSNLLTISGTGTDDPEYINASFDIARWISTNVGIRIIQTNTTMGTNDIVWFDDIRISSTRKEYVNEPGGLPPTLATNITLQAGDYLIAIMQAAVDNPTIYTQVVNTASVTSDQQLVTLYASVTDLVEIADLGVGKVVLDPIPDQGGTQAFTLFVTNFGPYPATSIFIQDVLPTGVTYVGHSTASGSYSPENSLWNLGSLGIGSAASLTINVQVNDGTAGSTITNRTSVYSLTQGDLNPTNDSASATFRVVPPFIITDCDYETSNSSVQIQHQIVSTQQLYDLLYCDAITFRNTLSNQWQLADRRAGGLLVDTGSVSRTAPANLASGTLRFYRISAPTYWEDLQAPRRAGKEVLAFGVSHLQPGENWVRPWGDPCNNTIGDIFEHALPAGASLLDATRVLWFARDAWQVPMTAEVFHVTGNAWLWIWPTNRVGESAENSPVPLYDGFMVQIPSNLPAQNLPMIFRVPTNNHVQTIPRNAGARNYAMVSQNLPETWHPIQMNLIGSGFKGHLVNPALSDQIWKFNRAGQAIAQPVWYRTSDSTWRLTSSGFPLVPTNYFAPDDGLVITIYNGTGDVIWTNRFTYSAPTREMNP